MEHVHITAFLEIVRDFFFNTFFGLIDLNGEASEKHVVHFYHDFATICLFLSAQQQICQKQKD